MWDSPQGSTFMLRKAELQDFWRLRSLKAL
jgi:hypothetical protein